MLAPAQHRKSEKLPTSKNAKNPFRILKSIFVYPNLAVPVDAVICNRALSHYDSAVLIPGNSHTRSVSDVTAGITESCTAICAVTPQLSCNDEKRRKQYNMRSGGIWKFPRDLTHRRIL
jgi:hypothetical protein